MAEYIITTRKRQYGLKTEKAIVTEADEKLKDFVGKPLFDLIKECERRKYTIEKIK